MSFKVNYLICLTLEIFYSGFFEKELMSRFFVSLFGNVMFYVFLRNKQPYLSNLYFVLVMLLKIIVFYQIESMIFAELSFSIIPILIGLILNFSFIICYDSKLNYVLENKNSVFANDLLYNYCFLFGLSYSSYYFMLDNLYLSGDLQKFLLTLIIFTIMQEGSVTCCLVINIIERKFNHAKKELIILIKNLIYYVILNMLFLTLMDSKKYYIKYLSKECIYDSIIRSIFMFGIVFKTSIGI